MQSQARLVNIACHDSARHVVSFGVTFWSHNCCGNFEVH